MGNKLFIERILFIRLAHHFMWVQSKQHTHKYFEYLSIYGMLYDIFMQQKNAGKQDEKIQQITLPEELKRSYLPYLCSFPELEGKFDVKRELGRGSYGVAYKIVDRSKPTQKYALKRLFAITQARWILLEVLYLQLLYGKPNIIKYMGGIRVESQVDILFEYIPHQNFAYLIEQLDLKGVKRYMFQLLKAISMLESYGIMHRDIKPTNFLYSTKTNRGVLIDFGLSELVY